METIDVLLVDDHTLVRQGIRRLIEAQPSIRVIGEAEDGAQAVRFCRDNPPDVVVMDISMPAMNGLLTTTQINRISRKIRVLVLSMHADEEYVFQSIKAGASGYIVKKAVASDLVDAIRSVARGEDYFSPTVSRIMADDDRQENRVADLEGQKDLLTLREEEILQLIAEGNTSRQIADKLCIGIKTVETHRWHLMQKLEIHDLVGLVKYAIKRGIIHLDA
jgi:two-component system, NarL family, response regulator NreC